MKARILRINPEMAVDPGACSHALRVSNFQLLLQITSRVSSCLASRRWKEAAVWIFALVTAVSRIKKRRDSPGPPSPYLALRLSRRRSVGWSRPWCNGLPRSAVRGRQALLRAGVGLVGGPPLLSPERTAPLGMLRKWISSPSELLRRFASESTRPRGVWSANRQRWFENPELGLPILEPLRSDRSCRRSLCERWLREGQAETELRRT